MIPKKRKPTHPGEMLLKEFLKPMNISQKEFSEHLNWTYARLNQIIKQHRGITEDTALSLAEAFQMEPEFWLNLQRDWNLWHSRKKHKRIAPFKSKYPLQAKFA